MVDRLRKSVAELEPPQCPSCAIEMKWYQSALVQEAQPTTIVHHFHCPNCHRVTETKTSLDPAGVPRSSEAVTSAAGIFVRRLIKVRRGGHCGADRVS